MRSLIGAIAMAAGVLVAASINITPASAAPPVATTSPGYDARLAARVTDVSAQRRHRHYHHRHYRHYRPYYRPHGYYGPGYGYYRPAYRPYYYRPYYYRPYSPVVPFYGFGFGFGW